MYQAQKDNMLYMVKWWYSAISSSLVAALSYGYKTIRCLREKLRIMNAYVKIIECYKVFTTEPMLVNKIVFTDVDGVTLDYLEMEIDFDGEVSIFTYVGPADASAIVTFFAHQINYHGTATVYPFYAESVDNTLYVYNYNHATPIYATITSFDCQVGGVTYAYSGTDTSITNDPSEVLTVWNNLTQEQICDIYNHFKYLYESKTGTGNSQCCS